MSVKAAYRPILWRGKALALQAINRRPWLKAIAALALLSAMAPASAQERPGRDYSRIPEGAYSIVAQVRAKPGKESELRAATLPLVALVRGDPKNLVYFLQEDRAAPGHFIFYEVFANKEDFEAHNEMPYVKAWLARLPELAESGVTVMRMEVLNANR
jgi:quinol monooxygenase YgiN